LAASYGLKTGDHDACDRNAAMAARFSLRAI
jgi:hypothetical protein